MDEKRSIEEIVNQNWLHSFVMLRSLTLFNVFKVNRMI